MAAASSSSAQDLSWLKTVKYQTLELKELVENHASVFRAREEGTNRIFLVKRCMPAVGIGSKRYREALKQEGRMNLALRNGVCKMAMKSH
jgi:hypothetical protein